MKATKIPVTDSIDELARFWDTHDLTDFEAELEEVSEPVFHRDQVLEVRLPSEELEAVQRIARCRGVQENDLVHDWIVEKLRTA